MLRSCPCQTHVGRKHTRWLPKTAHSPILRKQQSNFRRRQLSSNPSTYQIQPHDLVENTLLSSLSLSLFLYILYVILKYKLWWWLFGRTRSRSLGCTIRLHTESSIYNESHVKWGWRRTSLTWSLWAHSERKCTANLVLKPIEYRQIDRKVPYWMRKQRRSTVISSKSVKLNICIWIIFRNECKI